MSSASGPAPARPLQERRDAQQHPRGDVDGEQAVAGAHRRHDERQRAGQVGGCVVRREEGCALVVGGRPARRSRTSAVRASPSTRQCQAAVPTERCRRPGDVHAPPGAHGSPDAVGREAGGLDDHLSTLGSVSSPSWPFRQ